MSQETFEPQQSNTANKETLAVLHTTAGTTQRTDVRKLGPDLMLSVKTAGAFFRFGGNATEVTATGTATTQGMWLPANAVVRLKKPAGATHFCTLQDGSAATIYIQPGSGM